MSCFTQNTYKEFPVTHEKKGHFYSIPALGKELGLDLSRLPVSIRIVLESVLRNCDGKKITEEHVRQLANWKPNEERSNEIPFVVARVILQDFTGIPLLVDLAAMRNVAVKTGKNPKKIEPLVPVDLVVDHSVQIDYFRQDNALDLNMKLEFDRNRERYQFMKWGMQAFDTFGVVPPGFGIVHQVNMEYLARGVHKRNDAEAGDVYYPDTLVGTDSHTTMINGVGVVGWGVGGIEAEAGMLGQPVYFLTPDVIGMNLTGKLREGCTATDLVLTITELLREGKSRRQVRRILRRRREHPCLRPTAQRLPIWHRNMVQPSVSSLSMKPRSAISRIPAVPMKKRPPLNPTSGHRACSAFLKPARSITPASSISISAASPLPFRARSTAAGSYRTGQPEKTLYRIVQRSCQGRWFLNKKPADMESDLCQFRQRRAEKRRHPDRRHHLLYQYQQSCRFAGCRSSGEKSGRSRSSGFPTHQDFAGSRFQNRDQLS